MRLRKDRVTIEFVAGFMHALYLYAYMKDGVYYVGSTGKTWFQAKIDFINENKEDLTEDAKDLIKNNYRKELEASIFSSL